MGAHVHLPAREFPAIAFTGNGAAPRKAPEGWIVLDWSLEGALPEHARFELQQARKADFAEARLVYAGRDTATFLSGLPEGTYWYRLRVVAEELSGEWSRPLSVEVHYIDRRQVWILLAAGAVAFLATAGTLLSSHRRVWRERLET